VVREPLGGAHRDFETTALNLREALMRHLTALKQQPLDETLGKRYQRMMSYGAYSEDAGK
jgi:acetyl-CoA carboxylase carboxyl transferase subunit alpha